jgi:hypothetical protein
MKENIEKDELNLITLAQKYADSEQARERRYVQGCFEGFA